MLDDCKYCAEFVRKGIQKVPHFEEVCATLKLDPKKRSDQSEIVQALTSIGQFGTIRLARKYPDVTDEAVFQKVARTALEFYWLVLDERADIVQREAEAKLSERDAEQRSETQAVEHEVRQRMNEIQQRWGNEES
jgi:hypothetical protein